MKVLAADGISPKGIELLQKEFEVVVKDKLPAEELSKSSRSSMPSWCALPPR